MLRVIKDCDRLPRDIAKFLSLEILKSWLDKGLGNLRWLTLLYSGALSRRSPEIPPSLNYSVILWLVVQSFSDYVNLG